jgi:Putative DNA-binding domain
VLPLPSEQLTASTFAALCHGRCPEAPTLDFKRELPGRADQDMVKFLKDVCALSNSDGSELVYGIAQLAYQARENIAWSCSGASSSGTSQRQ